MRKFLLLSLTTLLSLSLSAQIDTLIKEDFENGIPTSWGAFGNYRDTNSISVSGNSCLINSGIGTPPTLDSLELPVFSTQNGNVFVFLNFQHIAKFYFRNNFRIELSNDSGATWVAVTEPFYRGPSVAFTAGQNLTFTATTYQSHPDAALNNIWRFGTPLADLDIYPDNSWWVREAFDFTNFFEGPTGAGYKNCQIRFVSNYTSVSTAPGTSSFFAGWHLDDVFLLRSNCELTPPRIDFGYPQIAGCIANKPENGIVENPDSNYPISLAAFDDSTDINRIELRWRFKGATTFNVDTMSPTTYTPFINGDQHREFIGSIMDVNVGDTVEWFVRAFDNACPNVTRSPDSTFQSYYVFYPEPGYPAKCGNPFCGVLPTVVNTFPWVEDFESPEFGAGSGPGTGNNLYRGTFPSGDVTGKYWTVNPAPNLQGFAWSVRGGTTPTLLTGPSADHSPSGNQFIYTEGDQGNTGNFTNIVTPCLDLTNESGCLAWEFWYHMYGDNIGRISIEVDDGANTPNFTPLDTIDGPQQDSTDQGWKRHIIDLSSYTGSFIRLRLKAFKGFGTLSDIAIDDFKVFTPPAIDDEILDIVSPLPGGCSYVNEDVTVTYRHSGCNTTTFIPFAYQVNGGPIVRDSAYGSFSLGDEGTFTFSQQVNLSAVGSYDIVVWTDASTDGNTANDTLVNETIDVTIPFNSFPYIEDFEGGTVGTRNFNFTTPVFKLVNGADANYGWQVGQELTPLRNTGPWRGYYFDKDSKYIYTSSNSPTGGTATGRVSTYLESIRCLDFTGMNNPLMTFMMHMYGADIDRLEIEYSEGVNGDDWKLLPGSTILRSSQQSTYPSEVSDWQVVRVDLSQFANQAVKIRIKGTKAASGLLTHIAIDNLQIFDRKTSDLGISRIQRPNIAIIYDGNVDPIVRVENYTNSAVSSVPVTLEIIPLCNQRAPSVHTQTITANVPANGNADLTFDLSTATPPLVYPVGEFVIKAYTNVSNDGFAFNDTVSKNLTRLGSFGIPFEDNFDSCGFSTSGWAPSGQGFRQWELGPPGAPFNSAFSSPNAWTVNQDGNVIDGTTEVLFLSRLAGFDTVFGAEVQFYQNGAFGGSSAGMIEFSVSGGWDPVLGADPTQGINWVGTAGVLSDPILNGPGWNTGIDSRGWIPTIYPIGFYNKSSFPLDMRFRYVSTSGASSGGWSIDNFELYVPPQNSASPVKVKTVNPLPVPGLDQPLEITVQNTGAKLLKSYIQEVIWDVGLGTQTKLGFDTIQIDTLRVFKTQGSLNRTQYKFVVPGNLTTPGLHDVCVITYRPNYTGDNLQDDTLCTQIRILDEFEFDNGANSEYCDDFDGNKGSFEFFGLNNYTYEPLRHSWEKGVPIQFPTAFSAPNVWMTDLDSNYKSRDSSALFSPVFIVDTDTNYEVSFVHYYETERATDGGSFLVSNDGGQTWQVIGFAGENNWFNTPFINALDIIKSGWSDTSGGWDSARYVFNFDQDDKVVFKFRFESDWDIEYPGWAIDNFCLKQTSEPAGFAIGQEEYNPVESVFFGELAPNPSKGGKSALPFTIPDNKGMDILVTNMMGQMIEQRHEEFERGSNAIFFDSSTWSPGVYNISVAVEGEVVNRRLVVQ